MKASRYTSWLNVADGAIPKIGKTVVGEVENKDGTYHYGFFQLDKGKKWRILSNWPVMCDGDDNVEQGCQYSVKRWIPLKQKGGLHEKFK